LEACGWLTGLVAAVGHCAIDLMTAMTVVNCAISGRLLDAARSNGGRALAKLGIFTALRGLLSEPSKMPKLPNVYS